MLKPLILAAAVAASFLFTIGSAAAAEARATGDLPIRSGPGSQLAQW